jgi:hypothetical protein
MEESRGSPIGKCTRTRISHDNYNCITALVNGYDLLKRYAGTKLHTFPAEEDVPIDGVARGLWREAILEKDAEGRSRVNRITYDRLSGNSSL